MRIISGGWKGRRLKPVKGKQTRPTSDKVKGAIFNILGSKVVNAKVLDLFAGTGNLALEALSRGAVSAVLVEKSSAAWETIKDNLVLFGAVGLTSLLKMDAFNYLKNLQEERFDLIFVDPPYHQGLADKILLSLSLLNYPILNPGGVIIIETSSDESIIEDMVSLEIRISRKYGDTKIWFIQEREELGEGS